MLKIPNRLVTIATVTAAAAAIAITGTAARIASPQISKPTTVRLLAHGGTLTVVNVRHAKAFPEVGDEIILSQPVYAAAHPKQVVGHLFVIITFVASPSAPPAGTYQQVALTLKRGEIDLAGAGGLPAVAVTGGTGAYLNARGQAIIKPGPGKGEPSSITITLLP